MNAELLSARDWLTEITTPLLHEVLTALTGQDLPVRSLPGPVEPLAEDGDEYRQILAGGAEIVLAATSSEWRLLANVIVDDPDVPARETCQEVAQQVVAGVLRSLISKVGYEIAKQDLTVGAGRGVGAVSVRLSCSLPQGMARLVLSVNEAFVGLLREAKQAAVVPVVAEPVEQARQNMDLLLDVELPLTVSFGRAQLPLKEVVKLSSGSIVELNRSVNEPVEVIVNNCVVARGEVVMVEGNYGVRIDQVISRQERLRTLR